MKKPVIFLSIALILAVAVSSFSAFTAYTSPQSGKTRVLVEYFPGQKGLAQKALNSAGAEFHYAFDNLDAFAVTIPSAALAGLNNNPSIQSIEEDSPRYPVSVMPSSPAALDNAISAAVAASPAQVIPYGISMVQATDVWAADPAANGSSKRICVIDSGVFTGHEDFQGVSLSGYNNPGLLWNEDGFGHGTHVTGTITAQNNSVGVVGVLPGTGDIYMVRVFGNDGIWAYSSDLVNAAYLCSDAGANIISMSLAGQLRNGLENRAFNNLYASGILSVAAASNEGTSAKYYPASYDSVVSVAAIDSSMNHADFSNYNSQVELSAPGVGVLSTVPFIEDNSITVGGNTYSGNHIEFSARGTANGNLVDGGLCDSVGSWSGMVVLCERGTISFLDKVMNVQNGGGVAAVIYNNAAGNFLGTLGDGNSSTIIGISLSQADGQFLVASQLGNPASVTSTVTQNASGYEAWDGTSMATPHVAAVAAMVWSAFPSASNADIRSALTSTAFDLGDLGRDVYFGYGLVQAKAAYDLLNGGGTPTPTPPPPAGPTIHVDALIGSSQWISGVTWWDATFTVTVRDNNGNLVSGALVSGQYSDGAHGNDSCTTDGTGTCSMTTSSIRYNKSTATLTISGITASGFTYNSADNVITSLTVNQP